jgi:choline dehydrogenase-like flavoprotein
LCLWFRLSEISDWRVLLLETGGEEPPQADVPAYIPFNWNTGIDWQYQTEPQEGYCGGRSCTWNAGKVLGGGSVLNGMIYNRGNARSYDSWKELGKGPVVSFDCFVFLYQSLQLQNIEHVEFLAMLEEAFMLSFT